MHTLLNLYVCNTVRRETPGLRSSELCETGNCLITDVLTYIWTDLQVTMLIWLLHLSVLYNGKKTHISISFGGDWQNSLHLQRIFILLFTQISRVRTPIISVCKGRKHFELKLKYTLFSKFLVKIQLKAYDTSF